VTLPTDKDLLDHLKNGSAHALHEIFIRYHAKLCTVAFKIVRDRELAKDIAQQVFIKLWEKRERLTITSSLEGYLKRAAFNTALNSWEQQKRTQAHFPEKTLSQAIGNDVSRQLEFRELETHVMRAIDQLPVRTRAVFTMVRSEEMSYAEVADALQISVKAVEKEMMKALRLLREQLQHYLSLGLIILSLW
jgi:RNA polymerase sigma-70 factor, ECF subfamily